MRRIHPATNICMILGIMFLMMAYICATQDHLIVWSGDQQRHFTRSSGPGIFSASASVAALLGVSFGTVAWYLHFRRRLERAPRSGPWDFSWFGIIMFGLGLLFALAALLAGAFK
jgi:hypothetical protein